jgi:hypothetical protein
MFYFLQLGRFLGDSNQDVRSGLTDGLKSYLSKRVASITLCDGDYICLVVSVIQHIYIETPPVIIDLNCDLL